MTKKICCENCKFGKWAIQNPPCKECIGFSKFKPDYGVKTIPKPTYIGHRNNK